MAYANSGYPEPREFWLEEARDAQVLIIFNPEDKLRIEKYILQYLRKKNIKYVIPDYHIVHDGIELESITDAVNRCKKTLIILSKNSNSKMPISLEMILALEKSVKINRMGLMVLMMDGVCKENIPKIPVMLNASRIKLIDNIHERCLDALVDNIRAEVDLTVALPAGNFSSGMVWSHFLGYLKNILPELPTAITDCKWFNPVNDNERGRMPVCFFMLLPASGRAPTNITKQDENIRRVGAIEIQFGKRQYHPNVYEVTDPSEPGSKYYCCAEYPSSFCCLSSICDLGICDMTPQQRHLEVERFSYKMEEILNHDNNRQCRGLAKLVLFNDESKNSQTSLPSYHLLRAIKGELKKGAPIERLLQTQISQVHKLSSAFKFLVCLMYDTESDQDKQFAEKLRQVLDENKVKCTQARSQDPPTVIEERIRESQWVVMFVSQSSLKSTRWLQLWLAEILSLSASEGQLRVLPLLIDIESSDIPDFIRWVTYIDVQKEHNFCDRVMQVVEGQNITLESQVPVGNVAYGLSWSFEVNYLQHFLPEVKRLFDEKLKSLEVNPENSVCLSGDLYEIIPKSCKCQSSLATGDEDNRIVEVTSLKFIKLVHGTQRQFQSTIYRLKADDGKDYYFAGEYAAPVKTLLNMNHSMIAGLNNQQLDLQVEEFIKLSEAIQNCQDAPNEIRNRCKFVYFDDTKRSLSSILYEKMRGEDDVSIKNYWKNKNVERHQKQ